MPSGVTTIEIVLPWPPSGLSPNSRGHWARGATARSKFREQCLISTREQTPWDWSATAALLHLDAFYYPPDRRRYDLDNVHARMKSGIDGMCDSLGIDDNQFKSKCLWMADVRGCEALDGGAVRLQIRKYIEPTA